ncbi:hypothetical protein NP493_617g02058 [Ridgeia piscesae]|uniref:Uncharacterized protein n=1 Tax=Ridgeia piscesae TaxID=27915 RepID=A0AAD9NNP9_RIDPI|nr:hypothetical protein NP493_617g02058 [Ridgeia piscesae]
MLLCRTSFCCWILTLVLLGLMRRYGGYFSLLTGGCLLLAAIIYASIRNPTPLTIPFEDGALTFHWGWCFLLCLFNGFICLVLGIVVVGFDKFASQRLAAFFDADVAQDLEEVYCSQDELAAAGGGDIYYSESTLTRDNAAASQEETYEDPYLVRAQAHAPTVRRYRKRGSAGNPPVPKRKGAAGPSNGADSGNSTGKKPLPPPKAAKRIQVPTRGGASNTGFDEEEDDRM